MVPIKEMTKLSATVEREMLQTMTRRRKAVAIKLRLRYSSALS
jgi:hypothetical protein